MQPCRICYKQDSTLLMLMTSHPMPISVQGGSIIVSVCRSWRRLFQKSVEAVAYRSPTNGSWRYYHHRFPSQAADGTYLVIAMTNRFAIGICQSTMFLSRKLTNCSPQGLRESLKHSINNNGLMAVGIFL